MFLVSRKLTPSTILTRRKRFALRSWNFGAKEPRPRAKITMRHSKISQTWRYLSSQRSSTLAIQLNIWQLFTIPSDRKLACIIPVPKSATSRKPPRCWSGSFYVRLVWFLEPTHRLLQELLEFRTYFSAQDCVYQIAQRIWSTAGSRANVCWPVATTAITPQHVDAPLLRLDNAYRVPEMREKKHPSAEKSSGGRD